MVTERAHFGIITMTQQDKTKSTWAANVSTCSYLVIYPRVCARTHNKCVKAYVSTWTIHTYMRKLITCLCLCGRMMKQLRGKVKGILCAEDDLKENAESLRGKSPENYICADRIWPNSTVWYVCVCVLVCAWVCVFLCVCALVYVWVRLYMCMCVYNMTSKRVAVRWHSLPQAGDSDASRGSAGSRRRRSHARAFPHSESLPSGRREEGNCDDMETPISKGSLRMMIMIMRTIISIKEIIVKEDNDSDTNIIMVMTIKTVVTVS